MSVPRRAFLIFLLIIASTTTERSTDKIRCHQLNSHITKNQLRHASLHCFDYMLSNEYKLKQSSFVNFRLRITCVRWDNEHLNCERHTSRASGSDGNLVSVKATIIL